MIPRVLEERGARVEVVEAYQTVMPEISQDEFSRLFNPPPDAITFTSSSTATNFAKLVGEDRVAGILRGTVIASIGAITSDTLRKLGLEVTFQAVESTINGLVQSLLDHFSIQPKTLEADPNYRFSNSRNLRVWARLTGISVCLRSSILSW